MRCIFRLFQIRPRQSAASNYIVGPSPAGSPRDLPNACHSRRVGPPDLHCFDLNDASDGRPDGTRPHLLAINGVSAHPQE